MPTTSAPPNVLAGQALEPALEAPLSIHRARWKEAQAELGRLDGQSAWVANGRAVAFIAAVVLGGLAMFGRGPSWGGWVAWLSAGAYVALAVLHHRVFLAEERQRTRASLSERGVARCTGTWRELPERGDRFASPEHLCTPDLDVFGHGSLFQLVDQTSTRAGEEVLAGWLSAPADAETVRARQGAVRELTPLIDFREGLALAGRRASRQKSDPAGLIRWAEGERQLDGVRWARPLAWLLPAASFVLFFAGRAALVRDDLWLVPFVLQLLVLALTRKPLGEFYGRLSAVERAAARLGPAFAELERQGFEHPLLKTLAAGAQQGGAKVSGVLGRFSFLLSIAEARQSGQLSFIVNTLFLWDVHALFPLEHWRRRHGGQVRAWFEALAQLEALSSLAGFAHDRPNFVFPEVASGAPRFEAQALGHPLLDHPVRNDVSLPGERHALLITGSNMSGKTTLVRAMGANALLALAGAPVCAGSLTLTQMRVLTSMRVRDSLERGVSYFYAEVQRLKAVLDATVAANGRAMFLLDEILLGTNTRERQIASREVLRLLLATGAIGAVTTHDLSLAELADEKNAHVHNVHFRDLLDEGRMTFDYRLRQGVVDTTNALRVLAQAGIPIASA